MSRKEENKKKEHEQLHEEEEEEEKEEEDEEKEEEKEEETSKRKVVVENLNPNFNIDGESQFAEFVQKLKIFDGDVDDDFIFTGTVSDDTPARHDILDVAHPCQCIGIMHIPNKLFKESETSPKSFYATLERYGKVERKEDADGKEKTDATNSIVMLPKHSHFGFMKNQNSDDYLLTVDIKMNQKSLEKLKEHRKRKDLKVQDIQTLFEEEFIPLMKKKTSIWFAFILCEVFKENVTKYFPLYQFMEDEEEDEFRHQFNLAVEPNIIVFTNLVENNTVHSFTIPTRKPRVETNEESSNHVYVSKVIHEHEEIPGVYPIFIKPDFSELILVYVKPSTGELLEDVMDALPLLVQIEYTDFSQTQNIFDAIVTQMKKTLNWHEKKLDVKCLGIYKNFS